jgi:hypothetical protein
MKNKKATATMKARKATARKIPTIDPRAAEWRRAIALSMHTGPEEGRYPMVCLDCGREGHCVESLNDWGGISTWFDGFENIPSISEIDVDADFDAMEPLCFCGSTRIVRAEMARAMRRTPRRARGSQRR